MEETYDVLLIAGGLFLFLAIFFIFIGWRHHTNRRLWAWADLLWLIVSGLSFFTVCFNFLVIFSEWDSEIHNSMSNSSQAGIYYEYWRFMDSTCPSIPKKVTPKLIQSCDLVRKIGRELYVPNFSHIDANRLRSEIQGSCKTDKCIDQSKKLIQRLNEFYKQDLAKKDRHQNLLREIKIYFSLILLIAISLTFGPRLGRTIAEIRRESMSMRNTKQASLSEESCPDVDLPK